MTIRILGISAFYHDSAAALIIDGQIIAAAQEERFTRVKHDKAFPAHAVRYVLQEAGISMENITAVAFYDKPLLKFERLLETYHTFVPIGLSSFIVAIPAWTGEKLFMKKLLRSQLGMIRDTPILFTAHHLSHAASAYYPSPYEEAAILTIDGVGEWATTTICHGKQNQIKILRELKFPHSVGLLYSAFTYYLGFKVNSGEYKVMGLSPYGDPLSPQTTRFRNDILSELVDIREDGSILLNMDYFNFAAGLEMTNNRKWEYLFGLPRRISESAITQAHMNLALAIQQVTDTIVVALARTAQKITGSKRLVMAGGVALNCVTNSKIVSTGIFEDIWIQPAAGDAGGALGAAFAAFYLSFPWEKRMTTGFDHMRGSCLGPAFDGKDIEKMIHRFEACYEYIENFDELSAIVSRHIADGKVIGWFQGRMEFGPRSLGNRSILADPTNPAMQKILNQKIKYREGFRPFAPAVLAEDVSHYFDTDRHLPYMQFVIKLKEELRKPERGQYMDKDWQHRLYHLRSDIPAVTHVDYSSRVQTVSRADNPEFWKLINDFKKITGFGMLINTSFNVRGEPIVCTPEDAYNCFMKTEMDYLVVGNYLLNKKKQKKAIEKDKKVPYFNLD